MEEEAERYLNLARQLTTTGSYSKAFDFYIMAFEKNADIKESLEIEFRDALMRLNEVLVRADKMEDIFANFGKAVRVYPNSYNLLNDIGKYLYKFGFYTEAWAHFQKALKLDAHFVNAEKNLNSIKNILLERWHFRMLNDKIRNDAYYNAISECVIRYKDSLLDIGTGTGILAMFADDCSATAVTGVESSENMAWMAECVTQGNGKHDIVIVNKMSTTMNYRDIGGKRSIVVTEMFDAGLFGEHILQTLAHAWEYFTIPTSRIIPNKAEFFVVAAKSEHLDRKYRLHPIIKKCLDIPDLHVHVLTNEESYDSDDVHLLKDLKYISEPQSLLKIDFNDYRDIQEKLSRSEPYTLEFTAKESGEIQFFIGWFNLYLTKHITLTTDPRSDSRANAWQQAVFHDHLPRTVKKNTVFDAEFLINGGKLTMVNDCNSPIVRISSETLRFLNDKEYVKIIAGNVGMACVYLGQLVDISNMDIVDLSPFPVFGLLMMRRGARSLVCNAKTDSDKRFFNKVFKVNKVSCSTITILLGDDWGIDKFRHQKFHAIFCNIFDVCGEIDMRQKEIANDLRNNHLFEGGLFMPAKIDLHVQVVNSPWIDDNNRVYDKNIKNYKVGEFINKYEVTQNFCIDLTLLDCTTVTDEMNLGTIHSDTKLEVVTMPVTNGGPANAIMFWYSIEVMEDMENISTKRAECFMDGTLYLIKPKASQTPGGTMRILRCTDEDGSFKFMLGAEPAVVA